MARPRRLAILLSAAVLAAPSAAFAQGTSGAGDDQYEDPFAGGGSTNGQTTTGSQTSGGGSTLTQDPDLGTGSNSGTTSGTTGTPEFTGTTTGTLPNTGSDPRLIILAGLALLLSGFGLRLRTADEIF